MSAPYRYRRAIVLALATLLGVASFSAQASAQAPGTGAAYPILILTPHVITDVVFTGYDVVKAVQEQRASRGMAIAEIAVAGPQLLLASLATGDVLLASDHYGELTGLPDNVTPLLLVYTLWMAALTAHGVVALMPSSNAASPPPPARPRGPRPRFGLTPTLLRQSGALLPGLAASGQF